MVFKRPAPGAPVPIIIIDDVEPHIIDVCVEEESARPHKRSKNPLRDELEDLARSVLLTSALCSCTKDVNVTRGRFPDQVRNTMCKNSSIQADKAFTKINGLFEKFKSSKLFAVGSLAADVLPCRTGGVRAGLCQG